MHIGATAGAGDLGRFLAAQEGTYDAALAELRRGRKTGHWIWFVFPQLAGLGRSEMSRYYAIRSLDEARRYLGHPVLGRRLRECARALVAADAGAAEEILGSIDALKVRSSMTLFLRADPAEQIFADVLDRYYAGAADPATDGPWARAAARRSGRGARPCRRANPQAGSEEGDVADFERSTTVGVGAEAAFAFLSDPSHASEYVSPMTLDDSIAIDGDPEAAEEPEAGERFDEARFLADAARGTIEWGMPGEAYSGSFTVTPGTASTSQVTIRLHVRDDADPTAVERILGESVRSLQRLLSGR